MKIDKEIELSITKKLMFCTILASQHRLIYNELDWTYMLTIIITMIKFAVCNIS